MSSAEQSSSVLTDVNSGTSPFAPTRWSIVAAAAESTAESCEALETLCATYWQPIYGFIRRTVPDVEEAKDLTQGFFEHLLQNKTITRAHPERGRFRSFLLGAVKLFLANERERQRAIKRGGHIEFLQFDTVVAETRASDLASGISADARFDRDWALALLDRSLARLRDEFQLSGRGALFDALKPFLTGEKSAETYLQLAERLNITEGALKMTIKRMRDRFSAIVRQELAQTVSTPEDLEFELHTFVQALASVGAAS